jgi:hypothetical protein
VEKWYKTAGVKPDMLQIDFTVSLNPGTTCLEAWFTEKQPDKKYPAEFVYVERLGHADPRAVEAYAASNPELVLKDFK